jgi:hypothetical protein
MIFSSWRSSVLIAAALLLGSSSVSRAQQSPSAESILQVAVAARVVDQLSSQCKAGRGFNARESAAIAAWESEQKIEVIRTRLSKGDIPPAVNAKIEEGAAAVLNKLSNNPKTKNASPCELAVGITMLPQAKLATPASRPSISETKPEKQTAGGSGTTTATPSTSNSSPSSQTSRKSNLAALVAQIDSYGLDSQVQGAVEFLRVRVFPVVLFRNGQALTDVEGLMYPEGPDAHRRAHPDDWTQWRRGDDGRVELKTSKGWRSLPFPKTYKLLPKEFQLTGRYRSESGGGSRSTGLAAVTGDYTFSAEGRVVRGRSAGVSSGRVAISSTGPNQQGRYQIDGLILRMRYDDGSTEERLIFANEDGKVIWLDGIGYIKRKS